MNTVPVLNFRDFIAADGEETFTDSRKVAAVFSKRHAHVLDAIRVLLSQLPPDEHEPNFRPMLIDVPVGQGAVRHDPAFLITRDGFTLLAMGFTGKKALGFKVAYIKAFNAMAAYIKNQREGLQYQFLAKELEFKGRKAKVSASARDLRQWRDEKPVRLDEMHVLLAQMQPSLLPN